MTNPAPVAEYVALAPGDPAPQFSQRGLTGDFNLANLGGFFTVLAFFPSSSVGVGKAVVEIAAKHAGIFDGNNRFLALTVDQGDAARLKDSPGFQLLLDLDGKVARRYGALPAKVPPGTTNIQCRPRLVVLDRRMRVAAMAELRPDGMDAADIIPLIENIPTLAAAEPDVMPPILTVPRIFPPEFCRRLIGLFEAGDHVETGIVSQTGTSTTVVLNRDFKRRRDYNIRDAGLIEEIKQLLRRQVVPEIAKSFQFQVSHVERYIVCRYSAEDRGHFRAHRDNTSLGAAHRRFAVTLNLNDDYEGGDLSFPEFGAKSFRAPPGGAIVFSCSLMHAVSEVTKGMRYAFLPFLYDEAAAKILEANRASWTGQDIAPASADQSRL